MRAYDGRAVLSVILALSSSLCGGTADFLGGLQSRRLPTLTVLLFSQAVGLVLMTIIVISLDEPMPDGSFVLVASLGGLSIGTAVGCLYHALSLGKMMVVAPIAAAGVGLPVLVGLASGDQPGWISITGILVGVIGLIIATMDSVIEEPAEPGSDLVAPRVNRRVIVLAIVAAAAFGSFYITMDAAASQSALWAVLTARAFFVLLVIVAIIVVRPALRFGRDSVTPLLMIGVLDLMALLLFSFASNHGLLSIVSVLAALPPLVTVVLAHQFLGERLTRRQNLGIVAALAGIGLIAAGQA